MSALASFNPAELVMLEEACRIADRLDRMDALLRGEVDSWLLLRVNEDGDQVTVVVSNVLSEARQQATVMKQLIAALRVPDEASGKRPQQRGGARGAYKPTGKAAVSSLDRARAARGA
jgi:hypothetical protein